MKTYLRQRQSVNQPIERSRYIVRPTLDPQSESQLELQSAPPTHNPSVLKHLWRSISGLFSLSSEPQIEETVNEAGQLSWVIYDPADDVTLHMNSQQDVLRWLEERHHQQ